MTTPEPILSKIKLLLNLADSDNANESGNARGMADKLISKYNVTEGELASLGEKKPLYGEDEKIFMTIGLNPWRQQLVLAIGNNFSCKIVQEEVVPMDGLHEFSYFAYGDPDDVENVKFAYHVFVKNIDKLVITKCAGRDLMYITSYTEGVVEAIKSNIYWDGIDIPETKSKTVKQKLEKNIESGEFKLSKPKIEKEKPVQESVDVNSTSHISDVNAYWRGMSDGCKMHLQDIIELEEENEQSKKLSVINRLP